MRLSEEQIARIRDMHEDGKSEREIASAIGCSRSAVWGQLQKVAA